MDPGTCQDPIPIPSSSFSPLLSLVQDSRVCIPKQWKIVPGYWKQMFPYYVEISVANLPYRSPKVAACGQLVWLPLGGGMGIYKDWLVEYQNPTREMKPSRAKEISASSTN